MGFVQNFFIKYRLKPYIYISDKIVWDIYISDKIVWDIYIYDFRTTIFTETKEVVNTKRK